MALTALFSAATGMRAQETNIDIIANNIANVNTTAFKKARANFQDLLYQRITPAGAVDAADNRLPAETAVGLGVQLVNTQRIFSPGRLEETGRSLDLAIEGKGFFQIELPDDVGRGGFGYTRDGNLYVDANGQLVTSQGYRVQPNISISTDYVDIAVAPDGTISYTTGDSSDFQDAGQLELAYFANPEGLQSIGDNAYLESPASGAPNTGTPGTGPLGTIASQYLESSNVELVEELVNLIRAQRAFEFNSQTIKAADDMLQVVTNMRR